MSQYYIDAFFSVFSGIKQEEKVIENPVKMQLEMLVEPIMGYLQPIMWLFTVPVLKIALQTGVALAAIFLLIQIIRWSVQGSTRNPFAKDDREPRKPYIIEQRKRDEVLKQAFAPEKVPQDLDAIIIGSGIGGMSTGNNSFDCLKPIYIFSNQLIFGDFYPFFSGSPSCT